MKRGLLIAIFASPVFAEWSSTTGVVNDIYSHEGRILIQTGITDGPCSPGGFRWPTTDDDSKDMLSLALTSFSTGKKISVVFNRETPNCEWGYATITHMGLHRN